MVRDRKLHEQSLTLVEQQTQKISMKHRTWPTLQQRGLRRTGTNWARTLIHTNFKVHLDDINKHGAHPKNGPVVDTILMTRDLYAWLPSYFRLLQIKHENNKVKMPLLLSSFITSIGISDINQFDEGMAGLPVSFYCAVYRNWLCVDTDKRILPVKWENLLFNQEHELARIERVFGLERKHKEFIQVEMEIAPKKYLRQKSGSKWGGTNYHREEEFMSLYSPHILSVIRNQIDEDIMHRLGYKVR